MTRRASGSGLGWPARILAVASVSVILLFLVASYQASHRPALPVLGQVGDFVLTNQSGRAVSSTALVGQVWLADLIFTRCPGPCLKLTRNLVSLQQQLAPRSGVRLISLTADPEFDTPAVLEAYAKRFGADLDRWDFLTGTRSEINRIAMEELLLALQEKDPALRETENDLYLHSTKWVLIDSQGQLRSVYEGTEPASVRVALRDIRRLLREGVRS